MAHPDRSPGDDTERMRNAASEAGRMSRDAAEQGFGAARDTAAGRADQYSDALRDAAGRLQDDMLGNAMKAAADRLDGLSQALREQDLQGVVREVEGFARRQPALFLGGMVALGFAIGRFAAAGTGADAVGRARDAAPDRLGSGSSDHHHDRPHFEHHTHTDDMDHDMASETRRQAIRDGDTSSPGTGAGQGAGAAGVGAPSEATRPVTGSPSGPPGGLPSTQGGVDPQHRLPPTDTRH